MLTDAYRMLRKEKQSRSKVRYYPRTRVITKQIPRNTPMTAVQTKCIKKKTYA